MNTIPEVKVVEWRDTNLFGVRMVTWVLPEVRLVIMQSRAQDRRDVRREGRTIRIDNGRCVPEGAK